jgi:hypothetical protein
MSSNLNHYVDVDDIINVYEDVDNIELNPIYSPPPPLLRTTIAQNEYYSHQNETFRLKK